MSDFLISVPRKCVGKKTTRSMLFDKTPDLLEWNSPDARVSAPGLLSFDLVLDPLYKLRKHFPDVMWTNDALLVSTNDPSSVYAVYEPYESYEIPLNVSCVSRHSGVLRPTLINEFENVLSEVVDYCNVSICVTSNFILHLYGTESAVSYARYKLFVVLNHQYGYAISRLALPLSRQPLVAGCNRQNLLTLFQQTSVNLYTPPLLKFPADADVDEVYFAGDKVKIVIAEKLLKDVVIDKTDTLEKDCLISSFVRDTLVMSCSSQLEDIMLKHATFIQMPTVGQDSSHIVRVQGTTRRSISNTIEDIMKLCGSVYCVELRARLDHSLAAALAACGVNLRLSESGTVIYGLNSFIHKTLNTLKLSGTDNIGISLLIEQPLELMDFILGKKQGKVNKVVNGTGTEISVEKFHEHNFRLRLTGQSVTSVIEALNLLEAELPAEKSLYIPEVYHKQIIGQGGFSVQQIMRKYNVYMRFVNATREKYPNAFGDSRTDNVIIRCPSKNKAQIDSAAQELLQCVDTLAKSHHTSSIVLSRNHRRLLLASRSNALRDTEVSSGAAIKLPAIESHETQVVEISGQTQSSIDTAVTMMKQMLVHTDYEFRVPRTPRLAEVVGPNSLFGEQVIAPLFLAMGAQVQAFERVQMVDDAGTYSQIVVSVNENNEGECFEDISQVITSYLRRYNLDIVDQGKLNTEIQIGDGVDTLENSDVLSRAASRGLYTSPRFSEAKMELPTVSIKNESKITVPQFIPSDITSRQPMSQVQWNRNQDNTTPVKKRVLDESTGRGNGTDLRRNLVTPKVKMTHFHR